MTSEPPTESVGRNRPAPGARRVALGIEGDRGSTTVNPEHRSLLEALSHIPDLDGDRVGASRDGHSDVWTRSSPSVDPVDPDHPRSETVEPEGSDARPDRGGKRARPRPADPDWHPRWRGPAFVLALVVLVASIPALGYVGYRAVSDSRDGRFQSQDRDPKAPGYEAQVDPTPTAAVIQYGPTGAPVGVTFLSLGPEQGGGGVLFLPLATQVPAPQDDINRLADTYPVLQPNPQAVKDRLVAGVAALLDLGIEDVAEVDDARLAALAGPVAPIVIDNPEPVELADGTRIAAGRVDISATQVGPYLAATRPGETEAAGLTRSRVLWSAWLEQIRASTSAAPVGGELTSGLGHDLVELAKGPVDIQTLPVGNDPEGRTGAEESVPPDNDAIRALMAELVPSPTPTGPPGFRFRVRLLNGVRPGVPPSSLSRLIVGVGGTVTIVGNAPAFGQEQSNIVFADPVQKGLATFTLRALGGTGRAILDRTAPDTSDFTIVLGHDVLDKVPADADTTTTTSTTTTAPTTTRSGGRSTTTPSGD